MKQNVWHGKVNGKLGEMAARSDTRGATKHDEDGRSGGLICVLSDFCDTCIAHTLA